jgi:hypothetical protein
MHGINREGSVRKAARQRKLKVAPVTRAVRSALAASAAMLALAGTGPALAGDCTAPASGTIHCNGDFADTLNFSVEDLTLIVGDQAPSTIAPPAGNAGILADWAGHIGVTNSADIVAYADGIDAVGSGDIDIDNAGNIDVSSAGQVIGIYAYTDGGDVTIANSGDIGAYSMGGLADGIFASGGDVSVSNSGAIGADGYDWAAGIEAQGTGSTSVSNDGSISAYTYAAGGYAFGIYATGSDVTVANGGDVEAQGYHANGIYVQSGGNASVDNGGSVTAGGLYTSLYATGIHAASGGLDSAVSVTNSGDVTVNGYAGATGIEVLATGAGSTASASNSGDVYVNTYYKYASGSSGIVASADGDATVDNSGGIEVHAYGLAYGAMALSFNGDASATNSGNIDVSNESILYYGASGIVSSSQNGAAFADNSGGIDVSTKYIGTGIDASGLAGATVSNSGDIAVDAWRAYGIRASAGAGDVSVDNSGNIGATYTGTLSDGKAWGILALTTAGDISVVNSGAISTDVTDQSVGIFARPGEGNASVTNTGTIDAASYIGTAAGIFARADYGDVAVDNGGAISAYAMYGQAYGVLGSGVDIDVANGGSIEATGFYAAAGINIYGEESASVSGDGSIQAVAYGVARGVNASSGSGTVGVDNGGDIFAGSVLLDAIGIYAYSATGDVDVSNSGYVRAVAPNGLADGIFASGANVSVANAEGGAIVAQGYSWAAGIEAQGSDSVSVTNAGDIFTQTVGVSEGFGIYASGGDGGASVDNSGTIHVQGYDQATGIYARAPGGVDVDNSGSVYAGYAATDDYGNTYSSSDASAILAMSGAEGAHVSIDSSGYLYAVSFSASSGAEARSLGAGGSASVSNSGDVLVAALATGGAATGIVATADGDASADNAGGIMALSGGMAYGAMALSFNGDASVTNSGDIDASNNAIRYYSAYGIVSSSQNGSAASGNSGNIHVYSPYIGVGMETAGMMGANASNSGDIAADAWVSYGMRTTSGQGDVMVDNAGSIASYYSGAYLGYAFGMLAKTTGGDIAIDNSGEISADGGRQGIGIFATTSGGDVAIDSSGDVHASTYIGGSVGIFARASTGTATIASSGDVDSTATYGTAYGVLARGVYLDATTSGDTSATGYYGAYGVYLDGGAYSVLHNSGDISASTAYGLAAGVAAFATYGVEVSNSGNISATAGPGGTAVGVFASAYYDVLVENSGTITASHPDQAIAVAMSSTAGTATLVNSGTIGVDAPASGAIAVLGSHGANDIVNSGDIYGNIITFGADDSIENSGTLHLSHTGIYLGGSASAGNSFENTGTIRTDGYGVIDMGTGPTALVAAANPLPLVNDGVIDFVDGAPDDMLVVLGDLGGDGAINLDLSVLNGGADLLYVDGNVVDGTTQAINLSIDGTPTMLKGAAMPVVAVSGNVPAGSFVGGQVLNFDATNFLDLGVTLHTTSVGGANVLTAAVDVNGLNGTGVLGASLAQGMRSLVNSAVGTRSERMGLLAPPADGSVGISPWLRVYSNNGNLSPEGSGFGASQGFGFKQENRGREVGVDFAFGNNLSVGLLAGNADGDQRLDGGAGSTHLKQHGVGLYGTWTGQRFYVDVSHRTMNINARLHGSSGERDATAEASASSIEAGFTGWSASGFDIVPQVQYTRSKIDKVGPLSGSQVSMAIDGGESERGRVGVALSRTFAAGNGFTWTPYGSLSAVREFDGKSGFTIADTFSGSTSVEGSGTLAELGVGVRKGGLSATAGLNWADGGAVDNVRGGQVVVRYSW